MLYIFDFDYTLADTSAAIVEIFNNSFREIQVTPPSANKIKNTIGMSLEEAFSLLTGSDKHYPEFEAAFRRFADFNGCEYMLKNTIIYPDTAYVLSRLKKEDNTIVVFSAKDHATLEKCAERFQFKEYVSEFVGYDDLKKLNLAQKPSGDGLKYIINQFGEAFENCVYIGDSPVDYKTALDANIKFVGVTTGPGHKLISKEKDIVTCASLSEIFNLTLLSQKGANSVPKLFISWSGNMSKDAVDCFTELLHSVFFDVDKHIFFSPNIEYGSFWNQKISENLKQAVFGVAFLTRNNITSPWLNFELGGLSMNDDTNITVFKLHPDIDTSRSPITLRQECSFTPHALLTLLQSIQRNFNLKYSCSIQDTEACVCRFLNKICNIKEKQYYNDYSYLTPSKQKSDLVQSQLKMIYNYIELLINNNSFSMQLEIQLCDFEHEERIVQYAYPSSADNNSSYDLYFSDVGNIISEFYSHRFTKGIQNNVLHKNITCEYYAHADEEYQSTVRHDLRYLSAYPICINDRIIAILEIQFYNDSEDFPESCSKLIKSYKISSTLKEYVRNLGYLLCI